jgi:hypothetical protein
MNLLEKKTDRIHIRTVAEKHLSLKKAVDSYDEIYRSL